MVDDHPVETNCAPLLADLFLNLFEAYFLQGFLQKTEITVDF